MEIIAFHACEDHYSARKLEQNYFEEYKATLNSIQPLPKPKPKPQPITIPKEEKIIRTCESCNVSFSTITQQEIHNKTNKHIKKLKMIYDNMGNTNRIHNKPSKKLPIFSCEKCNYFTCKKNHFARHIETKKHKMLVLEINGNEKGAKKGIQISVCEKCNKELKSKSGLWKHKQKCTTRAETLLIESNENKEDLKTMIIKIMTDNSEKMNFLMRENQELRNQITELIPRIGNNNNNVKQKFNINVFLNEKCKDALSMDEFIDKIEISIKNLLTTREKGQAQGISNIIMENMNRLSLYERPLHCTDKKRETLYIKNSEWEKDDNGEQVNKAIKKIETKQLKNIKKWLDANPDYNDNPKKEEEFTELLKETSRSLDDGREKIIKTLCKELYVDK